MRLPILAALLLSACASVRVSTDHPGPTPCASGRALAHVHAQNWGVYFLYLIPVMTGNPDSSAAGTIIFADRARAQDAARMVSAAAAGLGAAALHDLQSQESATWIPLTPLWIRESQASGNACK